MNSQRKSPVSERIREVNKTTWDNLKASLLVYDRSSDGSTMNHIVHANIGLDFRRCAIRGSV